MNGEMIEDVSKKHLVINKNVAVNFSHPNGIGNKLSRTRLFLSLTHREYSIWNPSGIETLRVWRI